jgi:hypothetical protein
VGGFPAPLVARDRYDYYGSSATQRRQQRTVRLPGPTNSGSAGTAGTLPTFTHTSVGRVGAQLYPGDIAARYRNTTRGLARPSENRTGETALTSNEDRASRQPIAASFGAAFVYRDFNHWFVQSITITPRSLAPSAPSPAARMTAMISSTASTARAVQQRN